MSNALLVAINVWRASESVLIRPEAETRAVGRLRWVCSLSSTCGASAISRRARDELWYQVSVPPEATALALDLAYGFAALARCSPNPHARDGPLEPEAVSTM